MVNKVNAGGTHLTDPPVTEWDGGMPHHESLPTERVDPNGDRTAPHRGWRKEVRERPHRKIPPNGEGQPQRGSQRPNGDENRSRDPLLRGAGHLTSRMSFRGRTECPDRRGEVAARPNGEGRHTNHKNLSQER